MSIHFLPTQMKASIQTFAGHHTLHASSLLTGPCCSHQSSFKLIHCTNLAVSCRYEFQTEEEWQQYKETREQLPKAAFQFGVKRSDGRKSQKDLNASGATDGKRKDQKLDTQLNKIERLLTDKGHEHTSAFAKPPPLVSFTPFRDDGTGDGPAPKRKRL